MHYLLVQPKYYSPYPPLGLLKIAALKQLEGHSVELIKGNGQPYREPDEIFITSLFTYAWKPVHSAVYYYKQLYPSTKVILGGIYATLMPEHAILSGADEINIGLFKEAEELMPDYRLVPDWDASIVFSSRGCIRKCSFCAVPFLEPEFSPRHSIRDFIYPGHKRIIFWDSNFLANPYRDEIFDELNELKYEVDFNHGLDGRLITPDIALKLRKLRTKFLHLSYDSLSSRGEIDTAITLLKNAGFRGRHLIFYTLYNFNDSPEDFLEKLRDLMHWEVISYPMRYVPLDALKKNAYIAPNWTAGQLEMIADARRVMGFRGAFPPYLGLQNKIFYASNFEEAFALKKTNENRVTKKQKPPAKQLCEISKSTLQKCVESIFMNINGKKYMTKKTIIGKIIQSNNYLVNSQKSRLRISQILEDYIKKNKLVTTETRVYFK